MELCVVTGLLPHWKVTFGDGETLCFNSVRSMTWYLRKKGCEITKSNFYDLERQEKPSEKRIDRFRRMGIKKIFKIKSDKYIIND